MGKPSIFSREYQKKIKRRKRNIIIISLTIVLVISVLILKIVFNHINYTSIRENIQAWIDSDTTNISEPTTKEETIDKEPIKKEPEKPLEESIDIKLVDGNIAKATYVYDNNGEKLFKSLETADKDVAFNISPLGKQMIVTDINSTITLYNVDGTTKIISKDQYISSSGGIFTKEATIQANPKYLWNANPKFINEEKIIFVSNRPYFGNSTLRQYLWMTDIKTDEDKVFWESAGVSIDIGEKEEKGVKITVDGNNYYIDANGNYIG